MEIDQPLHTPPIVNQGRGTLYPEEPPTPPEQSTPHQPPLHGFLSYCHADASFAQRLQTHLASCRNISPIDLWDEAHLPAGSLWKAELSKALVCTPFAILLVSPDFLASSFIISSHLPYLLHIAQTGGTRILSVITRPCLFELSPLADFQPVNPPPARPISLLSPNARDQFWADLIRSLFYSH